MATIGGILVDLGLNVAQLVQDVGRAESIFNSFSNKTSISLGRISKSLEKNSRDLRNFYRTIAGSTFAYFVKSSIDAADALNDISKRTNVAIETVSKLNYVATLSGSSIDTFAKSVRFAELQIDKLRAGNDETEKTFKKLKLSAENFAGKSTEQKFLILVDSLSKIKDQTTLVARSTDVFGKSAMELIPTIRGGAAAMREMFIEAEKMGLVISAAEAKKIEEFSDKWDGLKLKLRSVAVDGFLFLYDAAETAAKMLIATRYALNLLMGDTEEANRLYSVFQEMMVDTTTKTNKALQEQEDGITRITIAASEAANQQIESLQHQLDLLSMTERQAAIADAVYKAMVATKGEDQVVTDGQKRKIEELTAAIYDMEEAQRAAKEQSEMMEKVFENAATNIQNSFSDMFFNIFRRGKLGFKDFADGLKDVFARTLAEMATLAIARPIIVPIVSAMGDMMGAPGAASGIASKFGGAGSIMQRGNLLKSLTGGLNTPMIGKGLDFVGPLTNADKMLQGFTPGNALAGFAGGFLANKVFGGGVGTSVGSAAGGIAGSAAAGLLSLAGPAGWALAALGAFAGGGIGSLFGPGRAHPASTFSSGIGKSNALNPIFKSKHMDDQFAQGIAGYAQSILGGFSAGGMSLTGNTISGGVDDGKGFLKIADQIVSKFDPNDENSIAAALKDFSVELAKSSDVINNDVVTALQNLSTEGKTLEEVINDINFEAMKDVLRAQFDSSIQDSILGILDPQTLAIQQLNAKYEELRATAEKVGGNLVAIEVAYGLERKQIVEQYASETADAFADAMADMRESAHNLRVSILMDKNLGALSVENRYQFALSEFSSTKAGFIAGTATFDDVQSSITDLLSASQDYWGESKDFYKDQNLALDFLKKIEDGQIAANDNDNALITETEKQTALLQSILESMRNGLAATGSGSTSSSAKSMLRANENAAILDTINTKNNLPEYITRQAKILAGFDYNDPKNANRSFADAVRAGEASAQVFNSIITGLGGTPQKFAKGGFGTLHMLGEDGRGELASLGTNARIYSASDTSRMMRGDNTSVVTAIEDMNKEFGHYRVQDNNASAGIQQQLEILSKNMKKLARALERKAA